MSFTQPPQSDPHPLPKSGLSRELEKLGRSRGSSATPHTYIFSPTPSRSLRKQLDEMSSTATVYDGSPPGAPIASPRVVAGGQEHSQTPRREADRSEQDQSLSHTRSGHHRGASEGGIRHQGRHSGAAITLQPSVSRTGDQTFASINALIERRLTLITEQVGTANCGTRPEPDSGCSATDTLLRRYPPELV